ncbi:MAG: DUF2059 domain-containing protein [Bryobacterales bacterium]|nr:DUF2059 domain-containing protein [Bryobacterales bacterium]
MTKTIGLVLGIFWLVCVPAWADEATKLAKTEELFKLMRMDQMLSQMMDVVMKQTQASTMQRLMGVNLPEHLTAEVEQFQREVGAALDRHIGWDALKEEYGKLYAGAFSEEEIDAIVAFYRSPAGQALVAKQPQLMEESSVIVQRKMEQAAPEVQALMAAWTEKLKAKMAPR